MKKILILSLLAGLAPIPFANAAPFVVYTWVLNSQSRSQSVADDDETGVDRTGGRVYRDSYRWYEIVDLGAMVDDGQDESPDRDIDDNTSFRVDFYQRGRTREHYFDLDQYDSDDPESSGSWAEFDAMPPFYPSVYNGGTVQIRQGNPRRPQLREHRENSGNNNFEYDETADDGTFIPNMSTLHWGYLDHVEGAVLPTRISNMGTIAWVPRVLSGPYYYYYMDTSTIFRYDEILEESFEAPGKEHYWETSRQRAIFSASLTSLANGSRGELTDSDTGETLFPGSPGYAVLALIQWLENRGFTPPSNAL